MRPRQPIIHQCADFVLEDITVQSRCKQQNLVCFDVENGNVHTLLLLGCDVAAWLQELFAVHLCKQHTWRRRSQRETRRQADFSTGTQPRQVCQAV